jgi:hypothetical protein
MFVAPCSHIWICNLYVTLLAISVDYITFNVTCRIYEVKVYSNFKVNNIPENKKFHLPCAHVHKGKTRSRPH